MQINRIAKAAMYVGLLLYLAVGDASVAGLTDTENTDQAGNRIPPGDKCEDPILIDPYNLPFVDNGQTTCGHGNDYNNTCLGNYDEGEDVIYELVLPFTLNLFITLNPSVSWTGIVLDDQCPPDPSDCIASSTVYNGSHQMEVFQLPPGTYYLMIDTWPPPECIPSFDLTIDQIFVDCLCNGDVNGDGYPLTVADLVFLQAFVNGGGPAPVPLFYGDLNSDCYVDQGDVELLECYFVNGPSCFDPWGGPDHFTCCFQNELIGACCEADTCFRRSPDNCDAAFGIYEGDWTMCNPQDCEGCCQGMRGDWNLSGGVDVADLTNLVAFLFLGSNPPPCHEEGDVNGSDTIDVADLTHLVDYLFRGGIPPAACP